MKLIKSTLLSIIGVSLLTGFLLWYFPFAEKQLKKHEQSECERWKIMESTLVNYYSINWQKEQCKQFNIVLK